MAVWLPLAAAAVGGAINAHSQNVREKRALGNQTQLMHLQAQNQRELNIQGHQLQMDMWHKTNYGPQMEEMRKAGLNPALMYGMSGGGGTTTGSQGGGSASGGQAPAPQQMMDIASLMNAGAQTALLKAQKENVEADTDNKKAQAHYTSGAQTRATEAGTGKTTQETETEKNKTTIAEAEARYAEAKRMWEASKMEYESRMKQTEADVSQRTADDRVESQRLKTIGDEIDNRLKEANINLTRTQANQLEEGIKQNWERISQTDTENNIKIAQTIINGISQVGGLLNARMIAEMITKAKYGL